MTAATHLDCTECRPAPAATVIVDPRIQPGYPIFAGAVDPQTEQARRWAVALENENAQLTDEKKELSRRIRVASAVVADMRCECKPMAPWCGAQRDGFWECPKHILERLLSGDE